MDNRYQWTVEDEDYLQAYIASIPKKGTTVKKPDASNHDGSTNIEYRASYCGKTPKKAQNIYGNKKALKIAKITKATGICLTMGLLLFVAISVGVNLHERKVESAHNKIENITIYGKRTEQNKRNSAVEYSPTPTTTTTHTTVSSSEYVSTHIPSTPNPGSTYVPTPRTKEKYVSDMDEWRQKEHSDFYFDDEFEDDFDDDFYDYYDEGDLDGYYGEEEWDY